MAILSNNHGEVYENVAKKVKARCFILYRALIPSRLIRQMLANVWELNSKELYQSSKKEKESYCLVFLSSTKREIRQFRIRERKQERRRRQRKRHLKK